MIDTKQVEAIFADALEYSPQAREAFLASACGGHQELLSRVRRLLDCYIDRDDPLERPAFLTCTKEPGDEDWIGRRIGPYRLERLIASGGMGSVWLAERADEQFKKQVAVKLIKRGMDTEEILRRFHIERQVLANLEHPHIARLLDGGATDDGLPFLVMAYVDGRSIDRYCDEKRMPIADRLPLFRQVCSAVQFAHQNLVVHRDLKPSNILIGSDGIPKLLDFGIAKLLRPGDAPGMTGTESDLRMMTPEYASPEQVDGGLVSTATDVYSLGVLLYQLLTGHSPYDVATRSWNDYERAIRVEEPRRPSMVVLRPLTRPANGSSPKSIPPESLSAARSEAPQRLQRILAGDLDTIVLKALRKEPDRRYASVDQFSEDLRRYAEGLPVLARPDTWRYRTGKFVRRHRVFLLIAAVFLLLVMGFAVTSATLAVRLNRERMAAVEARDHEAVSRAQADQINAFRQEMRAAADPVRSHGQDVTVREILDEAAKKIEQSPGMSPRIEEEIRRTIGRTYEALGLYNQAEPHIRRSLELCRSHDGPESTLTAMRLVELGHTLQGQGKLKEAADSYRQAAELLRHQDRVDPAPLSAAVRNLGTIHLQQGSANDAEPLLKEAVEIAGQLPESSEQRITAQADLGSLFAQQGKLAEAESILRPTLDAARAHLGTDHERTLGLLNNLTLVLKRQKKLAEARPLFKELHESTLRAFGARHRLTLRTQSSLASILQATGDVEQAESLYRGVLDIQREILGEYDPDVLETSHRFASLLNAREQRQEAIDVARRSLKGHRKVYGEDNPYTAMSESQLAEFLFANGASGDALIESEQMATHALAVFDSKMPPTHPVIMNTLILLERLYGDSGLNDPVKRAAIEARRSRNRPGS